MQERAGGSESPDAKLELPMQMQILLKSRLWLLRARCLVFGKVGKLGALFETLFPVFWVSFWGT